MSYALLHSHSQFSLLNGLDEPSKIVEHCAKLGIGSVAITDISSISGAPTFLKDAKKAGIKPILGCEIFLEDYGGTLNLLCVNKKGWQSLLQLISHIHTQRKTSLHNLAISKDELFKFISVDNLIAVMGAPQSILCNQFFSSDMRFAYANDSKDQVKTIINNDWVNQSTKLVNEFQDHFGQKNVVFEAIALDNQRPVCSMVVDGVRYLGNKLGLPVVVGTDSRYCKKGDAGDFRTFLSIGLETTPDNAIATIEKHGRPEYLPFFDSFNHFIPDLETLSQFNTEREIKASLEIAARIETFDIIPKQNIPTFPCPNGLSQDDYLRQLCRDGWKRRGISDDQKDVYSERVKKELGVFTKAKLASYFLIVQDYVNAARARGELVGVARGSAAGSLVSYLIGITDVDPIPYDLIFERFYNEGRNSGDHIAMPDIDIDFESNKRQNTMDYIKDKYGHDKVAQVLTFIKIKGKGALKDVLRMSGKCSFELMNKMTENVPDESAISDKLQEMKDDEGESNILRWSLHNMPEEFAEWAVLNPDGSVTGQYAREFAQAIRLEGARKAYGKHAAGLIVSDIPLHEVCPVFLDKSGKNKVVAFEFKTLEALNFTKFDILATTVLDKMMGVQHLLNGGDFEDD